MPSSRLPGINSIRYQEIGKIVKQLTQQVITSIGEGMSTMDIEDFIHGQLRFFNVESALKGYYGYNYASTICVNNAACNQIPSSSIQLKSGDLITVDIPIKINNIILDNATCFVLGKSGHEDYTTAEQLASFSRRINAYAISQIMIADTIGDLHKTLKQFVSDHGFHLVNLPFGHVSGRFLHLYPSFSEIFSHISIKEIIKHPVLVTIEPIVSTSSLEPFLAEDGWTWKLQDNSLACYTENVVWLVDGELPVTVC
jgi:methionyl aminopeptidase